MVTSLLSRVRGDAAEDATTPDAAPATGHQWPDPTKPSAVLVAPHVRETIALARIRRWTVLAATVALALALCLSAAAWLGKSAAVRDLDRARAAETNAQAQVANLSPVADYYDGLEERRTATVNAVITDIRHADMLRTLRDAFPAGVSLDSYATAIGAPCPGPDPFAAAPSIGCVAVAGTASSADDVTRLLTGLKTGAPSRIFTDAFVTNMDVGEDGSATFSLNINFTDAAFSLKYVPDEEPTAARQRAVTSIFTTQIGVPQ